LHISDLTELVSSGRAQAVERQPLSRARPPHDRVRCGGASSVTSPSSGAALPLRRCPRLVGRSLTAAVRLQTIIGP
jgi:hypothetical protein